VAFQYCQIHFNSLLVDCKPQLVRLHAKRAFSWVSLLQLPQTLSTLFANKLNDFVIMPVNFNLSIYQVMNQSHHCSLVCYPKKKVHLNEITLSGKKCPAVAEIENILLGVVKFSKKILFLYYLLMFKKKLGHIYWGAMASWASY